ncbi:DNA translocase FtsK [Oscillibacter valericigenes]|nr:DNA translocase FtsK [Oscillibacter valericigenes]
MATQKKASSGKRTTTSKKTTGKRATAPKKRPIRREVGGVVCLVLALCIAFSYFQQGGWLLDQPAALCRGLVGYGYYAVAPVLLLVSYILLFHRGRNVTACVVGAALLPLLLGAMLHLVLCKTDYDGVEGIAKLLWRSGLALESGGLFSATLAIMLVKLVKKTLAMILLAVLFVTFLMLALRLTPAAVLEAVRAHERIPYEPEDEEEEVPPAHPAAAKPKTRIDIPLDGEKREAPRKEGRLSGFFAHKPDDVRTPDELLSAKAAAAETAPAPTIVSTPVSAPTPAVETAPSEPSIPPTASAPPAVAAANVPMKSTAPEEVAAEAEKVAGEIETELEQDIPEYTFPPITLLDEGSAGNASEAGAELRNNSRRLAETIKSFGVDASAGEVVRGPSVTRYEFTLDQGVKLSKITNLADDIALALGASGVRIAPIPDKISVVGIEVPNKLVTAVHIREVIESREFTQHKSAVAFAVGKDIAGHNIIGNIAKLPHVLIAGTTGSGKSVCTNSLIVSLLYKSTPDEVRFIMVDPKMVELAPYNGIPHLLIPVVTDPKKAAGALQWAVYEMMKRYKLFSEHNVKDLAGYNALTAADDTLKKLPSVVVVIDELADLMLVAAKEVEESICRVAQMGRAAGMHLVIATQRPSADVITGLMKANIPSRIAFAVASSLESRIILDTTGAEKLVGRGDMLYAPLGEGKPRRVQGCFISAEEIDRVVGFVKENGTAQYDESVISKIEENVAEKERGGKGAPAGAAPEPAADEGDELLPAAVDVVMETGQASVSMLQRRLKLGYSRAARIVDEMETRGIVGPFEGSKPRQLLITREKWEEIKMRGGLGAMSAAAMAEQEAEEPPVEEEIP